MQKILEDTKRQIINEITRAPEDSFDAYRLRSALASIEHYIKQFNGKSRALMSDLLDSAWTEGADFFNSTLKEAGLHYGFHFTPGAVMDIMKQFAYHRIDNLSNAAWDKIRGELTLGTLGQRTPFQVMQGIASTVPGKGIFHSVEERALTITKTEMGKTFAKANWTGMERAKAHVPGLQKKWLHRGHPKKPRPGHLMIDGLSIPVSEAFDVGEGVRMMYPHQPDAPIDEIIHCGCDFVADHPSWH